MGLFSDPGEAARKANLKRLEDKRLAFARMLSSQGFAPDRMLFAQTDNGGFISISRVNRQKCLIISPGFGTDEDFVLERYDALEVRREEVFVKSEGLSGIFGMGKKGEVGVEYVFTRQDGSEVRMPFVVGRNSWMECALTKNPLLKTRRRRGDGNVVWEMRPVEKSALQGILNLAERYMAD